MRSRVLLIAEATTFSHRIAGDLLAKGYAVEIASDTDSAVQLAAAFEPEFVFVHVEMCGSMELMQSVQQARQSIQVVLFSVRPAELQ